MTRGSLLLSAAVLAVELVSRRGARGLLSAPRLQRPRHVPPLSATATAAASPAGTAAPSESGGGDDEGGDPPPLVDAVVVGGGPAGLLSAIMLARDFGKRVKVYERLSPPPDPTDGTVWGDVAKFYLIGLGERGQAALREFGVWDDVEAGEFCRSGERGEEPGKRSLSRCSFVSAEARDLQLRLPASSSCYLPKP